MNPIHVLSTKDFPAEWLARIQSISPRLVVKQFTADAPDEVPAALWAETEVLYTGGCLPTPQQAPNLRWVQLDTAGVNHCLNTPLWASQIPLTTLTGVAPSNMAEFALMMMLAFGHHLLLLRDLQARRHWPDFRFRWNNLTPRELRGATVGIVGYGAIGRELGRICRTLGMRVLALNRSGQAAARMGTFAISALAGLPVTEPDAMFSANRITEMMAQCDYVVVIAPYTPESHHLVSEAALRALPPHAVLINIARGGVVDEEALIRALQEGRLAGAALDVFAQEPLPADSPLWGMPNVIISPHSAGFTARYYQVVEELFGENLRRYVAGEPLLNVVDRTRGY